MTKNHENSPNITPVSGKKKSSDIVEATPILTEDTLSIDLSIDNIYLEDLPLNDLHLDDEAFSSMESIESMDSIEQTRRMPAIRPEELWFFHSKAPLALRPGHELRWQERIIQIIQNISSNSYEHRYLVAFEGIDQLCILKQGATDAVFLRYDAEATMLNAVFTSGPCLGLPKVFGHWRTDDEQFILIQHLQGQTLHQWLSDHPHNLSAGISILLSLLRLLRRIHSTGYILTSLRPSSIFLTHPDPTQPTGIFLNDFCNPHYSRAKGMAA